MGMPTFDEISCRVEAYAERTNINRPRKVERSSFAIALLAAGFGVLAGPMIGGFAGQAVIKGSLLIEALGLAVFMVLLIRREWRSFARAHQSFAQELDGDYAIFREYVSWLGEFSNAEIGRRLRYIRDRKEMMSYRLGLFTGGLERF